MDGFGKGGGVAQPEAGGAADVEDAYGCGEGFEQREEVPHALAAEAGGEGVWVGVVGDAGNHGGRVAAGRRKSEVQSSKLKAQGKHQEPNRAL